MIVEWFRKYLELLKTQASPHTLVYFTYLRNYCLSFYNHCCRYKYNFLLCQYNEHYNHICYKSNIHWYLKISDNELRYQMVGMFSYIRALRQNKWLYVHTFIYYSKTFYAIILYLSFTYNKCNFSCLMCLCSIFFMSPLKY